MFSERNYAICTSSASVDFPDLGSGNASFFDNDLWGNSMSEKTIWQACVAGVGVGMLILFYGLYVWINAEAQQKWPVAQAKVTSSEINRRWRRRLTGARHRNRSYSSVVEYNYRVSDQSFNAFQSSRSTAMARRYVKGMTVSVHYDPDNPGNSILEPKLFQGRAATWMGFVFCIGFPIVSTVLSKQLRSGKLSRSADQSQSIDLVQDPSNESEVLAWKQRNGFTV